MKRMLFLYRELAGYVVACINHLSSEYNVHVDVIAYPLNNDAPFEFQFFSGVSHESRKNHDAKSLRKKVADGKYDVIFVSGWADADYLNALRGSSSAVKVVGFDTWWYGTPKQWLASIYARLFITTKFDYAFVPGPEQTRLARHFGFPKERILTGVYSCDVPVFSAIAENRKSNSENNIKTLVYVGRYASEKYIVELCQSMIELFDEGFINWRLQCIGTGPLYSSRIEHQAILHMGFQQPAQLANLMASGDVFILPSAFEPWGVVVHEFAAAGYPLILSDAVGARHAFLVDQENGYLFKAGDPKALKDAMKKIMQTPQNKLVEMGVFSSNLAKKINPDTWAKTLLQLL